jgi:membrane protease YdiL (CAAX protease family)
MPPAKIGKFKASKTIVKESWEILKQDKEIMWFPVISSITTLIAILIMAVIFYLVFLGGSLTSLHIEEGQKLNDVITYAMLLVYYIIIFFIVNFFEAGLFIIVQGRFSGQNLSFKDGINGAKKNFKKIFFWSLISATVGVILQFISDKSQIIGKIVASIFGAAWNILTFFSLPSLIIGNLGVKDSFKESASLIRKTWGETIIIKFGVGLFFALITFLLLALLIGIFILIPSVYVLTIVVILFVIALIVIAVVSTTLNSIFKLALFNYARTGQVPQGFSVDIINGAVSKSL